jgi:GTP-binding protein
MSSEPNIRNVAIIAHVDHGKTTLVDGLLRCAGTFRTGEVVAERAMDSNDLERERGITILSKCTSVTWKGVRINLVDTPGHADFGGEVERVLGMVDAVLLVVDAYEGPMPQTRFVTQKAFEMGLSPLVVINKIDRPGVEPEKVMDPVFDLFVSLGASDHQLDFPIIYASGREGFAIRELTDERKDLSPLLDMIIEKVPPPVGDPSGPLCMQVATLDYDDFLGYMAIGRMRAGSAKVGDRVLLAHRDGSKEEFRVQKVLGFQGLKRFELAVASAGDVCAITGMSELNVGETITSIQQPTILAAAQDRRADDLDELPGQRRPVRRQGRQVRHQPQPARAPVPRGQEQRRPAGRGHRRGQRVQGVGPRRAPPVGLDRDHAPRGL